MGFRPTRQQYEKVVNPGSKMQIYLAASLTVFVNSGKILVTEWYVFLDTCWFALIMKR